ncbi:hypothetical protein CSB45_07350 [candidate division KSB3 bacterium]|uniref:Class I SAM-dependent methyltransferase n=1 Tax=candidate division KSB3 bacterium TaxID=2044937 RepID=A0A2G6E5J3_9BACT|nr:MAG: hypothetical protein CSB45_07350 [candidate division KSB3 bacterium]PIE29852.1 MAG: hypothetical protein CSA57_06055 [candidate division KSB3 bacterium]
MEDRIRPPACIFCNGQHFKIRFSVQDYLVRECLHCRLVQTASSSSKSEAHIDDVYDHAYFQRLVERKPQELVFHQRTLACIEQHKRSGTILDVGIGIGIFMELAQERGWDVQGVDPSRATCRYVRKRLQLPVHHGYLEALDLPERSFDVLSMRHVLEHVSTPGTFIRACCRLLKEDGILCLTVPNFNGLHARIEKERWFHLTLPYHVAHYTAKTLEMVLKHHGLKIVTRSTKDLSCSSYVVQIFNLFSKFFAAAPRDIYMSPQELDPSKDMMHWIVSKEVVFNKLMAKLGLGEELLIIAQKH